MCAVGMRSASSSVSRGGASSGPVRRWMCAAAAAVLLLGVALLSGARLTWGSGAAAPADLHARGSARRPDDAPCELYGGMPERPAGEAGLPAFLIAGAQKGGTTYLHSLLRQARPAGPRNAERNPPGRVAAGFRKLRVAAMPGTGSVQMGDCCCSRPHSLFLD